MKIKEKKSLAAMTHDALGKVLVDAQNAYRILKTGSTGKQVRNFREGRVLRQKIAVIQTLIRNKALVQSKKVVPGKESLPGKENIHEKE